VSTLPPPRESGERAASARLGPRHRRVAVACASVVLAMVGAAYAAVPLYKLFCQVTGYGGTTQRAAAPSAPPLEKKITVRFDANTSRLPWSFAPVERTMDVRIGETSLAFYRAENTSDKPVTGMATFNVTPEIAGSYFYKIECFCFREQTLEPGQSVEMPVSFYVDAGILDDPDARRLTQITLSYTFYPSIKGGSGKPVAADGATGARRGG